MRIVQGDTQAIVIDIQEKLFPHMYEKEKLLENMQKLLLGLKILNVPTIVTEQYPQGLGATVNEIYDLTKDYLYFEKISFSCLDNEHIKKALQRTNRKNVIIMGIESHVCILQTVIDLLDHNYQPIVIENCVTSRKQHDTKTAIKRMEQEGAIISTLESVLFEMQRVAGNDQFKQISKLVK